MQPVLHLDHDFAYYMFGPLATVMVVIGVCFLVALPIGGVIGIWMIADVIENSIKSSLKKEETDGRGNETQATGIPVESH
jgi:hypothetical protein